MEKNKLSMAKNIGKDTRIKNIVPEMRKICFGNSNKVNIFLISGPIVLMLVSFPMFLAVESLFFSTRVHKTA